MHATFVRNAYAETGARQKLYRLSEPAAVTRFNYDTEINEPTGIVYDHVLVSAVVAFGGRETYVFAANDKGEILDLMELSGSFRGALDIEQALYDFLAAANRKESD